MPAEELTPLGVEHVRLFLAERGITVREMTEDTSTAPLAAQALGTSVGSIVKSLLFLLDGEPFLMLVPGDRKVNRDVLARSLGRRKARMATPDDVLAIAGYPVGGVPPVAHRSPLPVLMDAHLLRLPLVFAAAGSSTAIFPIEPARLQELTRATVVQDVTVES